MTESSRDDALSDQIVSRGSTKIAGPLVLGGIALNIKDHAEGQERGGLVKLALPSGYQPTPLEYDHHWYCKPFYCKSQLKSRWFVKNTITGRRVRLDAVETAVAIQDANSPSSFEPSDYPAYYQHSQGVEEFYAGTNGEKDGHDPDYWVVIKFYIDSVSYAWRFHSHM